jgi:drug/metabolite transporter (DMT)-like permease
MEQIIYRINRFSKHKSNLTAYLALGAGILFLSFSPLLVRHAAAPGVVFSFYRMIVTMVILTPLQIIVSRKKVSQEKIPFDRRMLIFPLAAGFCSAFDLSLWGNAVLKTTISSATLLNAISPIWVSFIAVLFLKEKITGKFWIGLVLVMIGITAISGVFSSTQTSGSMSGNLLAFFSSFFYAGYYTFTELGRRHFSTLNQMWYSLLFSMLTLGVVMVLSDYPFTGYSRQTVAAIIVSSLVCQLGGYFCLTYALGKLPATVVSPANQIQPILSSLMAVLIFAEPFRGYQMIGAVGILLGLYLINQSKVARVENELKGEIQPGDRKSEPVSQLPQDPGENVVDRKISRNSD